MSPIIESLFQMYLVVIFGSFIAVAAMSAEDRAPKSSVKRYWIVNGVTYDVKLDAVMAAIKSKNMVTKCSEESVEKLIGKK